MGKDSKRLQWFITWPRTDYSKDSFLEDWQKKFQPEEIYVAQEEHKEEKENQPKTHLHCVIKLNFQRAVNKKTILDFCKSQYGDYEAQRIDIKGIRNWKYDKDKVLNYLSKEDANPAMALAQEKVEPDIDTESYIMSSLFHRQQERKEELEIFYQELEFKHVREKYLLCCDPRSKSKSVCQKCNAINSLHDKLRYDPFDFQSCSLQDMELKFLNYLRNLGF